MSIDFHPCFVPFSLSLALSIYLSLSLTFVARLSDNWTWKYFIEAKFRFGLGRQVPSVRFPLWRARVSPIASIAKEEIVGSLNVVERAQGARTWIGYPFDSTSSSPTRVNGINRLRLEAEIFSVINRLDITLSIECPYFYYSNCWMYVCMYKNISKNWKKKKIILIRK